MAGGQWVGERRERHRENRREMREMMVACDGWVEVEEGRGERREANKDNRGAKITEMVISHQHI